MKRIYISTILVLICCGVIYASENKKICLLNRLPCEVLDIIVAYARYDIPLVMHKDDKKMDKIDYLEGRAFFYKYRYVFASHFYRGQLYTVDWLKYHNPALARFLYHSIEANYWYVTHENSQSYEYMIKHHYLINKLEEKDRVLVQKYIDRVIIAKLNRRKHTAFSWVY